MYLNPRRVDFHELHRSEHRAKGIEGVVAHFVRLLCANRRLRVVLDKKVRPFVERKLLASADRGERVVVSGVQPFAQLPLRVLPVFCMRRYTTPSCLLGLAKYHLLVESCSEGLNIRFQKPDIEAHHAEMGNLLSLFPFVGRS